MSIDTCSRNSGTQSSEIGPNAKENMIKVLSQFSRQKSQ